MTGKKKAAAEIKRLPSGFWAVSVGGAIVDAASPTQEAARAKLRRFLKDMGKETGT